MVLVQCLDDLKRYQERVHSEYLDASIIVSDCFELDYNIHGIMSDCRVTYSLTAFVSAEFRIPAEIESVLAVAISDSVVIGGISGAIDIDLGQLYRDDSVSVIWTGRTSRTQVSLSNGATVFFDGDSNIVGVSATYESIG